MKLDARGLVGMGNSGKNSNTSQFFITFGDVARLTGKHVAFGRMVDGEPVLKFIEQCAAAADDDAGKPTHPVVIADCGVCGLHEPAPMAWVTHP